MKKLVSILLVAFMCALLGVVLTSCGGSAPKTTVTADEFEAAFDLGENWTVVLDTEIPELMKIQMTYKRDGNKFVVVNKAFSNVDNSEIASQELYSEIRNNVFYDYCYDDEAEAYVKEASDDSVEESVVDFIGEFLPEFFKDYSKFTYSEENRNYVAETLSDGEESASDITIAFEDGKIVAMRYSVEMEGLSIPGEITFTYGGASVTLPYSSGIAPKKTVTADEFEAAFDLGENWAVTYEAENFAEQQKMQVTYKRDGNKFVATQTVLSTVDNSEVYSRVQYAEVADNVFYMYWYDSEAQAYVKEASEDSVEDSIADFTEEVLPKFFNDYSKFTYSEENKNYVAESLPYSNGGYSTTFYNVTLAFEDCQIVSIDYFIESGGSLVSYVIVLTYGDASVTLPTVAAE